MVLPQAMAWVQYWFRVLSLKFCGKSKKKLRGYIPAIPRFLHVCLRPWWSYSHLKLSKGGQTALVSGASQRSGCKWVVCCPDYISGGDAGQDLSPPFLTWLFNCSPAGPPFLNVLIAPPSLQQPINLDSITRCCPTLTHTDPLRDAPS